MKKIILTLALVLIGICSFSQSPIQLLTYKNQVGWKNKYNDEYTYEKYVYSTITFNIYNDYISANDESRSIYRITEELPSVITQDRETTKALCYDEKNRKCIVAIVHYKDKNSSSIIIMYDDRIFIYVVDMQN